MVYNGFDDLDHYYREMSALGDMPDTADHMSVIPDSKGAVHNVAIPLCVVHAMDDPLITWRTVASNEGFTHPETLTKSGSGNLMILLTKRGGHVGWPLGWFPVVNKWRWMSEVAMSFARAVHDARAAKPKGRRRRSRHLTLSHKESRNGEQQTLRA